MKSKDTIINDDSIFKEPFEVSYVALYSSSNTLYTLKECTEHDASENEAFLWCTGG